jgi:hypothetical protein
MSRLFISTRGRCGWRERLASPDRQWKREYSAFETAVSWELASKTELGVPEPVARLFRESNYGEPVLMFAVAEHKVKLRGGNAASQCDLWAVLKTSAGMMSLTVEAKAKETFGNQCVEEWLKGTSERSKANRAERFKHICEHLPPSDGFGPVRYQMLHRCAASVIEAKRLDLSHVAFVVQAFNTPENSFQDYTVFCRALKVAPTLGTIVRTTALEGISVSFGWADCRTATDAEIAATA